MAAPASMHRHKHDREHEGSHVPGAHLPLRHGLLGNPFSSHPSRRASLARHRNLDVLTSRSVVFVVEQHPDRWRSPGSRPRGELAASGLVTLAGQGLHRGRRACRRPRPAIPATAAIRGPPPEPARIQLRLNTTSAAPPFRCPWPRSGCAAGHWPRRKRPNHLGRKDIGQEP